MPADTTRRRLLLGLGAATLALPGCKVLDAYAGGGRVHKTLASANALTYRAQRLLGGGHSMAQEFDRGAVRQGMRPNGVTDPADADYRALAAGGFADWRLTVTGLVGNPLSLDLPALMALPSRTQVTRHDCVEGWSCIAEWTGVQLSRVLEAAEVAPGARFAVFRCMDTIEQSLTGGVQYWESIDMTDALHPQTILAYGMNGAPLPVRNGAPLRLRVERQLGYKMAKYLRGIELVERLEDAGGYWPSKGYDWHAGI